MGQFTEYLRSVPGTWELEIMMVMMVMVAMMIMVVTMVMMVMIPFMYTEHFAPLGAMQV